MVEYYGGGTASCIISLIFRTFAGMLAGKSLPCESSVHHWFTVGLKSSMDVIQRFGKIILSVLGRPRVQNANHQPAVTQKLSSLSLVQTSPEWTYHRSVLSVDRCWFFFQAKVGNMDNLLPFWWWSTIHLDSTGGCSRGNISHI